MNRFEIHKYFLILLGMLFVSLPIRSHADQAIIVDHTCTDISKIPDYWINQIKSHLRIHYAHTSHGEQPLVGCSRWAAANPKYNYDSDNCLVPQTTQCMSLMDGQHYDGYCETYVTPDLYWEGHQGLDLTRSVLSSFDVNISMWAWCSQLDYYTQNDVQAYLDNMDQLEREYPGVTFVYMTGNAQGEGNQNRYERNQQIRDYCRQNNKVLFDFADLDCWYGNDRFAVDGIPSEHPQYRGDEAAHTTYESCENKAKAFWWLLAQIQGWDIGEDAIPEIEANGSDSAITVSSGSPVSITIFLNPRNQDGQNADWWIVRNGPNGWSYYDVIGGAWSFLQGLSVTYQGPLFNFSSFEILSTLGLSLGNHRFYFGVDMNMNGTLDMNSTYYDSVNVEVIEP